MKILPGTTQKKMKILSILATLLVASSLHAEELTLYSHRHYPSDDELFAKFTEQTGIKVNIVKAGADELIERVKAEGDNTAADVLITADAGRLERAKNAGVLQPVESEILEARIPENLRDPENQWFGFALRARVLAYAKDRVRPEDLSTYEGLAGDEWKGRILVRSSSNIYNQSLLASIIASDGSEKALEWATAVRKNMARPPQGSDRDQVRAVAKGLGDVAIVNTYYIGLLATSEEAADREAAEAVTIFFPNQEGRGTHVNVSGAGVTKASRNKEAAVKLLEFLVSDEAQKSFSQATYEYPVVEGVEWSDLQQGWGKFKADDLNLSKLGEFNEEAVMIFNKAGWE